MTEDHINFVDSILTIKSSGLDDSVAHDLSMPQGKTIAELIYDQEEKNQNKTSE